MPLSPKKTPAYCLHKASGRAVVRLNGRDCYLGAYRSVESYEEYDRLTSEWRLQRHQTRESDSQFSPTSSSPHLTINELILRYGRFAEGYYVKNGEVTQEFSEMKLALRPLRKLFGRTFVRDFGPLSLKKIRQHMIEVDDLSRGVINNRINRIRRVFKWAVSEELAPPGMYEGLRAVAGLRYGRTSAREMEPVKPVALEWVDAVLPYVSPTIAAMIQLQYLTAMRPCEVVAMRPCDIDMSGDVWIYELLDHKNRWRGHERMIAVGPKAQLIIQPFISRKSDSFLFSPIESEEWRNSQRRNNRITPMTPSQAQRKAKSSSKRPKRDRYDVHSFRRAITYGIKKANKDRDEHQQIPHWTPLQLRHTRATDVRKEYGIEAAQVVLGHVRADVTQIYAERNLESAMNVAKHSG